MKLDSDDQDVILAYTLSRARVPVPNSGAIHIHHLAKARSRYMESSIEIASRALARIQYDSLYGS